MLYIAVNGVNRFCRSKSSAGSRPSVNQPTGRGSHRQRRREHRVEVRASRRCRGARAARAMPSACAKCGPGHGRAAITQVAGQRTQQVLLVGRDRRARGRHRPHRLERRHGLGRDRRRDVLDACGRATRAVRSSAPRPSRTSGSTSDVDGRVEVAPDAQPARFALARGEEVLRHKEIRVAGLRDRDGVEERGGVADGAGERPEHATAASRRGRPGRATPVRATVFSPTRPHTLAGMRIDPPPSLPCAIGTKPAATAAAAPPLDPPARREVSHGVRAGGPRSVSV